MALIRRHPALGGARLVSQGTPDTLVVAVARQHHERLDGSGYPNGLRGDQIHRVSRICAVVDSFDAMTALRPFKQRTMCISDAIIAIKAETPAKYDPEVVEAWLALLNQVDDRELVLEPCADGRAGPAAARAPPQQAVQLRWPSSDPHPAIWNARRLVRRTRHTGPRTQRFAFRFGRTDAGGDRDRPTAAICYRDAGGADRVMHGQSVRCRAYEDGWFNIGVELFRPG